MAIILDGNNTPTLGGIGYGDGSELAFSAAGTAGQVLTSAGGAAPTWATMAASPVTLITSTTATAASSVVFTGLSTTYGVYLLEYDSVFGSAIDNLILTISSDNGATYYSSSYATQGIDTIVGSTTIRNTTNGTFFYLGPVGASPDSIQQSSSGIVWIYGPARAKRFTAKCLSGCPNAFGNMQDLSYSYGGPNGTTPINAIKITFAGGATITGSFRLYGYAA